MRVTGYEVGLVVGATATVAVTLMLEGAVILLNGSPAVTWTTQRAVIALLIGCLLVGIAVVIHRWVKSVKDLATEVTV
jgi:hypothetical protein